MATFKIGDRVRIVGCVQPKYRFLIGLQGTVLGAADFDGPGYYVSIDGVGAYREDDSVHNFKASHIAPLTPPHEAGSWEEIEKLMPSIRELFA